MNRSHARFESLEGAILLGEASADERVEFARHARQCSLCNSDAGDAGAVLLTQVESARDAETWRPSVERSILARIRDERMRRSRFAVGALGWAAALSIAVNVAFVTGLAGKLGGIFDFETAPATVASEPFGTRLPARTFATIKRRSLPAPPASVLALHRAPPHRPAGPAAGVLPGPGPLERAAVEPAHADIFAGLDLRGSNAPRNVAVETRPCEGPCAAAKPEQQP